MVTGFNREPVLKKNENGMWIQTFHWVWETFLAIKLNLDDVEDAVHGGWEMRVKICRITYQTLLLIIILLILITVFRTKYLILHVQCEFKFTYSSQILLAGFEKNIKNFTSLLF